MKRAALITAVLGFAVVFAGCRGITEDLHDIYTVTFNPNRGYVNGIPDNFTMRTDVRGRLTSLPEASRHGFRFVGWYSGITRVNRHTIFDRDSSVLARWEALDGTIPMGSVAAQIAALREGPLPSAATILVRAEEYVPPQVLDFGGNITVTLRTAPLITGTADITGLPQVFTTLTVNTDNVGGSGALFIQWERGELWTPYVALFEPIPGATGPTYIVQPEDVGLTLRAVITRPYYSGRIFGGPTHLVVFPGTPPNPTPPPIPVQDEFYPRTLYLEGIGAMFTVRSGVTLIIEDIEMRGAARNTHSTLVVEHGGELRINEGVFLTDNHTHSDRFGGAVTVNPGGSLIMDGGRINRNTFRNPFFRGFRNLSWGGDGGGAVWVRGGHFVMNGGKIDENVAVAGGGGVRISRGGTFILNPHPSGISALDPLIYDNSSFIGGGVMVSGNADPSDVFGMRESFFIMNGGLVEYNWSTVAGGGVALFPGGRFYMHEGMILNNESSDGVGVINIGANAFIHGGAIAVNVGRGSGTAGITNEGHLQMWGGAIFFNDGGFGGGIRNWADFQLFGGEILGNIGNGFPGGGIFNAGHFQMHGGQINHNISNSSQGGGILHGFSGDEYSGEFTVTGGMIWNNRDLTTYHPNGLPGSMGNIRRSQPRADSFHLARPGLYSLDPSHAASAIPLNWVRTSGPVPVFNEGETRPAWYNSGAMPAGWPTRTVYFFAPPAITYPPPAPYAWFWTTGRPRVDRLLSGEELLVLNTEVPSMATGNETLNRGGVTFPSSLTTLNADGNARLLVIRDGIMVLFSSHVDGGAPGADVGTTPNVPSTSFWPGFPGSGFPLPDDARWPWVQAAGGSGMLPFAARPTEPVIELRLEEHPIMERLRERQIDLREWVEERLAGSPVAFPEITPQQQREWVRYGRVPGEHPVLHQLLQDLEDRADALAGTTNDFGTR